MQGSAVPGSTVSDVVGKIVPRRILSPETADEPEAAEIRVEEKQFPAWSERAGLTTETVSAARLEMDEAGFRKGYEAAYPAVCAEYAADAGSSIR